MAYPDSISQYPYTPTAYNKAQGSLYNRSVFATGPYTATGSSAAFLPTGSANVIVNLNNGGQLTIPASTTIPVEVNVASVVSGSGYLLYYI